MEDNIKQNFFETSAFEILLPQVLLADLLKHEAHVCRDLLLYPLVHPVPGPLSEEKCADPVFKKRIYGQVPGTGRKAAGCAADQIPSS